MVRALFDEAIRFFDELETNNTRQWWAQARPRYEVIRAAFVSTTNLVDGFGPWRVYRPHNDRRFQPDATAYKTFLGAVAERSDGVGAFIQISRRGLLVGTGLPMPAADQLRRLRDAIAHDATGIELVDAIRQANATGAVVHGGRWAPLKRVPTGYSKDCERAELLRWKGIEVDSRMANPPWGDHEQAAEAITTLGAVPSALHRWLGREVGPSQMTPEERYAPKRARAPR